MFEVGVVLQFSVLEYNMCAVEMLCNWFCLDSVT